VATKERSPNYPQIGLTDAVDLIKKFYDAEGRTLVDNETAAKALGYGGLSGRSRLKLAALKQYGLLQGREDSISISPLGLRIIHPDDEDDYASALREAARAPAIFLALLDTHLVASENAIVAYLVKNKSFTSDGAKQVAKSFKDAVALAKLTTGTHTDEERPPENGGRKDAGMQPTTEKRLAPTSPPSAPPLGAVQRTFTTGNEAMDAAITITSHAGEITGEDIAFLREYLDFLERSWARRKPRPANLTDLSDKDAES